MQRAQGENSFIMWQARQKSSPSHFLLTMLTVIIIRLLTFLQYCLQSSRQWCETLRWHVGRYRKSLSWRFHQLQRPAKRLEPIVPSNPAIIDGLHRLPPEIRLQIYGYLLPHHYVVQPEFDSGRLRARFGLLATNQARSETTKFIRNDDDRPSTTLRTILEDGGSFLHQTSPRIPSTKMTAGRLICGDGEAWHASRYPDLFGADACAKLLRTSKSIYRELIEIFYSRHTFSFFGPEMLRIFLDQVSLEGLRSIKHIHLAVPLTAKCLSMEETFKQLADTMTRIASDMPNLQHLDVEIVVNQSPTPKALREFIAPSFKNLRLHSLEDFVLKISVLQSDGRKKITQENGAGVFAIADAEEYRKLKASLIRHREGINTSSEV